MCEVDGGRSGSVSYIFKTLNATAIVMETRDLLVLSLVIIKKNTLNIFK